MSFKLLDQGELAVVVNGVDLLLGADTVESLTVIEDVKSTTPTLSARFLDNKLQSQGLGVFQDGAPITVVLGDGKQAPRQYALRQWSLSDGTVNAFGNVATLSGVADAMPWLSTVIGKAQKGNASDVAQQLAQQGGIPLVDVDSTQDQMTWLPDGRTISKFVRNMVDRAWMGSGSCPHVCVTSQNGQWMLRLKDIMQSSGATQTFASAGIAGESDITVWDYRVHTKGGPLNTYTDYGHKVVQEMLNGQVNIWQQFSFSSLASVSGISSALQGAVSLARTFYHPPDTGNTHPNYAQALHNNRMARASFSVFAEILTDVMSDVKLMDDVQVTLANTDGTVNDAYSGNYKVTNIARHMAHGSYREKLSLANQGYGAS